MANSVENVYSLALFELCCEENILTEVFEELEEIELIVFENEENREFAKLLSTPAVSAEDKKQALSAVFGGKINERTFDFLKLLCDKGRMAKFPDICKSFREKYNEQMNILEVTAVTARPLNGRLREKLVLKLEKISGKSIVLKENVDKSVVGGILLRYGRTEIDSTVKSRLETLRKQIDDIIA